MQEKGGIIMGFLMNVLNYGWNAGCVFTEADREYRRICKSAGLPIIDMDAYEQEMDEEEESDIKVVEKVGGGQYVKSIIDFILKPEALFSINGVQWKAVDESELSESEVIITKFNRHDIVSNIAAVVNYFGIKNDNDMQLARTQIVAILYMTGLADTNTVFEALNKDTTSYAVVNERVRMYSGKPMDEKLIKIDIDETVNGDMANDKLKLLTDWERTYLTGRFNSDILSNKLEEVFKDIMDCIE